jgi:hypothetical protein
VRTHWEDQNPNLHPLPQRKKHIGPLDVAYRLVSSGCKEFVFITMFVTLFLPTWNLPTKVKIPIYLDAKLFGTLVGLGFKALELQNPKKITSWITGSYQLVNLDASMLSCFHVTGLHVVPKAQSIRWGGASPISWLCCHENWWIVNVIMKVCFWWSFYFPPTNKTLSHSSLICLKNCEIWVFALGFCFC